MSEDPVPAKPAPEAPSEAASGAEDVILRNAYASSEYWNKRYARSVAILWRTVGLYVVHACRSLTIFAGQLECLIGMSSTIKFAR